MCVFDCVFFCVCVCLVWVCVCVCVCTRVDGHTRGQAASESGEAYYYDTDDAYNFYLELWGGDHCHVGIYPDDIAPVNLRIPSTKPMFLHPPLARPPSIACLRGIWPDGHVFLCVDM